MKQQSFSDYEYSCRKKKTKREEFLDTMEGIIPWDEGVEFVRQYYPSGKRGRPVKGIEKMLRMYLLQVWFNLSDRRSWFKLCPVLGQQHAYSAIFHQNRTKRQNIPCTCCKC